ncbi:MAG: adventurous gliding motility protein CglE [Myxococcaceae bacterium]
MSQITKTVLALAVVVSSLALAQKSGAPVVDKEAPSFNEIERGFHMGLAAGYFAMINPPASSGPRNFSNGQLVRVDLGFDIGERVGIDIFAMATANRNGSDYLGNSAPPGCATAGICRAVSGDFNGFIPGIAAKVNIFGFNDANDVQRLWIYGRVGAGYAIFSPAGLVNSDIFLLAGMGVEYFTQLRHFTIGIELTPSFMINGGTIGFAATPNLRYAF